MRLITGVCLMTCFAVYPHAPLLHAHFSQAMAQCFLATENTSSAERLSRSAYAIASRLANWFSNKAGLQVRALHAERLNQQAQRWPHQPAAADRGERS